MVLAGLVTRPIVTPEEFELIKRQRDKNKAYGGRKNRTYILSGFIHCAACGRHYSGKPLQKRRFPYGYRCGGGVGPVGSPHCRQPLIPGPWLEDVIWNRISEFLMSPAVFLPEAAVHGEKSQDTAKKIRVSLAELKRQKAQYEGYKQRAYDGLVRGLTDEKTYHQVLAGYDGRQAWLEQEMVRQQSDLDQAERVLADAEAVRRLYPLLRERLERATAEDKRFVLDCLGTRILPGPDSISVELAVPSDGEVTVNTNPGFHVRSIVPMCRDYQQTLQGGAGG